MEFDRQRRLMVERQLLPRGIRDKRLLSVMSTVPRHLFLSPDMRHMAYEDMALQIGEGQTMSQPYMVAVMTQLLELTGGERVLEIGTGSGYQTAVLAELATEVFSIERIASLSEQAAVHIRELGYENIHLRISDGTEGWAEEAPFDRILVTAGTPSFPGPLLAQLSESGIALAPVGSRWSQQLVRYRRQEGRLEEDRHTPCVFVPLVGRHGWSAED